MSKSFLVFVIKPPPDLAGEIDRVRKSLGIDRRYARDRLHSTLLPLGERATFGECALGVAMTAVETIGHAPFHVVFDRVEAGVLRGSDRIDGLFGFQDTLVATLAGAGLAGTRRFSFRPHITLSYGDRSSGNHVIDGISWIVDDFLLIESLHGEGRHVELKRWRLNGD